MTIPKRNNETLKVNFLNEKIINKNPGPGAYQSKVVKLKGGKLSSTSTRFDKANKENLPGVGAYNLSNMEVVSKGSKIHYASIKLWKLICLLNNYNFITILNVYNAQLQIRTLAHQQSLLNSQQLQRPQDIMLEYESHHEAQTQENWWDQKCKVIDGALQWEKGIEWNIVLLREGVLQDTFKSVAC